MTVSVKLPALEEEKAVAMLKSTIQNSAKPQPSKEKTAPSAEVAGTSTATKPRLGGLPKGVRPVVKATTSSNTASKASGTKDAVLPTPLMRRKSQTKLASKRDVSASSNAGKGKQRAVIEIWDSEDE